MSEVDEEFDRAREKSQGRFRSAFEAIFAKYGHIDEEDDIIDLSTGKLIVDNGRMRNADIVELGDLLRYSERSSSPLGHVHVGISPHSRYTAHSGRDGSLSPELVSNVQLTQRAYKHGASGTSVTDTVMTGLGGGAHSSSHSASSDDEPFDIDFISHTNRQRPSRLMLQKQKRENEASSAEDEDTPYDYDSSDSMDPGQDTLDAYFTSSIEQYLDKLRQQLSGPPPIEHDHSISSDSDPEERGVFLQTLNGKRPSGAMRPFHLPSSPRTASSQNSDDHYSFRRQRRYTETNSRFQRIYSYRDADEHDYVSESASQTSGLDKENPQPATASAEHTAYEVQYSTENLESKISQSAKPLQRGLHIHSSSAYELDEEVISEEEPMETPGTYQINTVYDSRTGTLLAPTLSRGRMQEDLQRPIPVSHWLYKSAYDDSPQNQQQNNGEYFTYDSTRPITHNESVLYTQRASPSPANKAGVYFATSGVSPQIRAPVIRKPQPVAPHVFFECDSAHSESYDAINDHYNNSSYSRTRNEIYDDDKDKILSIYDNIDNKGADDDASIHSGESLHSLSPTPEQQYLDDSAGAGNIYNTANSYSVYDMQITEGSGYFEHVS
ncbi:hypothetical protein H4R20_003999 [Coemansia guatemalensis]|uniref:Uncharacterized protein n=1 Tax=Coemansia guatemalensis TaxID=2761395 RepID=A0A9W8LS49_9FUNG|nr:hypothetical protein H4R20_003999 [Coemansia guatemalensis]